MKKLLTLLLGATLLVAPSFAQLETDISIPEFRQCLYDFAMMIDAERGTTFAVQFQSIPDTTLARWYKGVPNGKLFQHAINGVKASRQGVRPPVRPRSRTNSQNYSSAFGRAAASPADSRFSLNLASPGAINTVAAPDLALFVPGYPSGPSWDVIINTVQVVGLLPPGPTANYTATRCDSNLESYYSVLVSTFQGVKDAADSICEIVPNVLVVILGEGTEVPAKEICFGVTLILNVFNSAAAGLHDYCEFQDGLVNSAQTEATYYNTLALYNQKLRLKIEQNLQNTANPIGLFELPSGMGGFLEIARAIVADTIAKVAASNPTYSVAAANVSLTAGDGYFNARNYKFAYKSYQKAYMQAIQ